MNKSFREQFRNSLAGARTAAHYAIGSNDSDDFEITAEYLNGHTAGYQEGLYAGYEGALGLFETTEDMEEHGLLKDEVCNQDNHKIQDTIDQLNDLAALVDKLPREDIVDMIEDVIDYLECR